MKKFLFFILIIFFIILSRCVNEEESVEKDETIKNLYPSYKYNIEDMEKHLFSKEYINGSKINYLRICENKDYIEINNYTVNTKENTLLYYPIIAFLPEKYNEPRIYIDSSDVMRKDNNILIGESNIIEKVNYRFIIFADSSTIDELDSHYGMVEKSDETLIYYGYIVTIW